jgi:hypothetical protein
MEAVSILSEVQTKNFFFSLFAERNSKLSENLGTIKIGFFFFLYSTLGSREMRTGGASCFQKSW